MDERLRFVARLQRIDGAVLGPSKFLRILSPETPVPLPQNIEKRTAVGHFETFVRPKPGNKAAIRLIPECGATFHGPECCKRESPASTVADAASRLRPGISIGTARRYCSYPTPCSNTRSRSSN